jgi:hypothetical protein
VSRAGQGSYDEQQTFQGQTLKENTQVEYTDLDQWTEYTYCLTEGNDCGGDFEQPRVGQSFRGDGYTFKYAEDTACA